MIAKASHNTNMDESYSLEMNILRAGRVDLGESIPRSDMASV